MDIDNLGTDTDAVLSQLEKAKPYLESVIATPSDLEAFLAPGPIPPNVSSDLTKTFNYDIGHAGRFTVFESGGGSLHPDAVFSPTSSSSSSSSSLSLSQGKSRRPLSYIHDVLCYGSPNPNEVVVFSPGLNTFHQPRPMTDTDLNARKTSPMRIGHYVNVIGVGMAQAHTGTLMDGGPVTIPVSPQVQRWLKKQTLITLRPSDWAQIESTGTYTVQAQDRDKVATLLSEENIITTPLKETFSQLIDAAVTANYQEQIQEEEEDQWGMWKLRIRRRKRKQEPPRRRRQPHLVLMAYSRASVEIAAALQAWKQSALIRHGLTYNVTMAIDSTTATHVKNNVTKYVEQQLRDALTVVTIGSASRKYPDGPAYIHIASYEDKLTKSQGVNSINSTGGGSNAVYLNVHSPYNNTVGNDAHNFGAITCQYVGVLLRYNNVTSYRQLYNMAHTGTLHIPSNLNDLVNAMIVATRGTDWLWNPDLSLNDLVQPLPDEVQSKMLLDNAFGVGTFDTLVTINEKGAQGLVEQFTTDIYNESEWMTLQKQTKWWHQKQNVVLGDPEDDFDFDGNLWFRAHCMVWAYFVCIGAVTVIGLSLWKVWTRHRKRRRRGYSPIPKD